MYREVTMYRIECDAEGCEASPSDGGEYHAWLQKDGADDDLSNTWDWYANEDIHLCPAHAPTCPHPDCGVSLRDTEFGIWCEDHAPEEPS